MASSGKPVAGHGTLIAADFDGSNTLKLVGELNTDINWPELKRAMSPANAHQRDIDSYVPGVSTRGEFEFSVNFIFDNDTHSAAEGVQALYWSKDLVAWAIRGPEGSGNDEDVWISSGHVSGFKKMSPVREGVYTANCKVQFSGPMIVDGQIYGAEITEW